VDCQSCGHSNRPEASVCTGCGAELAVTRSRQCGEALPPRAQFCPVCGNRHTGGLLPHQELERLETENSGTQPARSLRGSPSKGFLIGLVGIVVAAGIGGYYWRALDSANAAMALALGRAQSDSVEAQYTQAARVIRATHPFLVTQTTGYQEGQYDLPYLRRAASYNTILAKVIAVQAVLTSDLGQYASDFNSAVDPDNTAWQAFPFRDGQAISTAKPYVQALSVDAARVVHDTTAMEQVQGYVQATVGSDGDLSAAIQDYSSLDTVLNQIQQTTWNEWSDLNNDTHATQIAQDIQDDNALLNQWEAVAITCRISIICQEQAGPSCRCSPVHGGGLSVDDCDASIYRSRAHEGYHRTGLGV
jgi:hypothetical protein